MSTSLPDPIWPQRSRAARVPKARFFTFGGVVGLATVGLVVFLGIGLFSGLLHIGNPFDTRTVDHSPPAMLQRIRELHEYRAATAEFQQIVDVERDVAYVPSFLAGERTQFVAVGQVDAFVDFSTLGTESITTDGTQVTITLPAARLAHAQLDATKSKVINHDRGLGTRIGDFFSSNPDDPSALYQLAEAKLDAAAATTDVLSQAEQNTRHMLEQLGMALGYDSVTVTFAAPVDPRLDT